MTTRGKPLQPEGEAAASVLGWRTSMAWAALAASVGLAAKLYLSRTSFGCQDVLYWYRYLYVFRQFGLRPPYLVGYNHPPVMLDVMRLFGWLNDVSGVSFAFWLRLPSILAEAASVLMIARLLSVRSALNRTLVIGLVAFAPAALLVSGFHGNTDGLLTGLLVLSVFLACGGGRWTSGRKEAERWALAAGLVFGLALAVKVSGLLLLPPLLLWWRTWRGRWLFAAGTATMTLVAWSALLRVPAGAWWGLVQRVLFYGSSWGNWGWSALPYQSGLLLRRQSPLALALPSGGVALVLRVGTLLVCALLAWWALWRRGARLDEACGLVMSSFFVVAPGFAPQYLAWFVPWMGGGGVLGALVFDLTSGWYLKRFYGRGANGWPWVVSHAQHDDPVMIAALVCWLGMILVCMAILLRIARRRDPERAAGPLALPPPVPRWRLASAVAVLCALPLAALWLGGRHAVAVLPLVPERFDLPFVTATSTVSGSIPPVSVLGERMTSGSRSLGAIVAPAVLAYAEQGIQGWRSAGTPTARFPQELDLRYDQPLAITGFDLTFDAAPGHAWREWTVDLLSVDEPGRWISIPASRFLSLEPHTSSVRFPALWSRQVRVRVTRVEGSYAALRAIAVAGAPAERDITVTASSNRWGTPLEVVLDPQLDPVRWDSRIGWQSALPVSSTHAETLTLAFSQPRELRRITLFSHPLPLFALRAFRFQGLQQGTWRDLPETVVAEGGGATAWSFALAPRRLQAIRLVAQRAAGGFAFVSGIFLDPTLPESPTTRD